MKYLILGKKTGWLARRFKEFLGKEAEVSEVDATDFKALEQELANKKPEFLINAVGKTGRPNIDWCETHTEETMLSNFYAVDRIIKAIISAVPKDEWPILVHLSSGCIYQGGEAEGWDEGDLPSPQSFYAKSKWLADQHIMSVYANKSLILRLRLPIEASTHPRNLLMKLLKYPKIIIEQNSITIIPDFLKAAKDLMDKKAIGVFHIVNPGVMSPAEIMEQYQKIVDPAFKFEKVRTADLEGLIAPRSNCILSTKRLNEQGIILKPIQERIPEILEDFKNLFLKEKHGKVKTTEAD